MSCFMLWASTSSGLCQSQSRTLAPTLLYLAFCLCEAASIVSFPLYNYISTTLATVPRVTILFY